MLIILLLRKKSLDNVAGFFYNIRIPFLRTALRRAKRMSAKGVFRESFAAPGKNKKQQADRKIRFGG
jgi:hypothetical protein